MRRLSLGTTGSCVAGVLALTALAHAQTRLKLVVQRAQADLASETLLIAGEHLLGGDGGDVAVVLAGTPLTVLNATEAQAPRPGAALILFRSHWRMWRRGLESLRPSVEVS